MNINGRMKVKTLKAEFNSEFGLTLRVYDGRSFADDDATLASIRKGDSKGGEFSPRKNTKVGNLEDKIEEMFGIKTQIAGSDDSYLSDNDKTLAGALEADEKLMEKRANRSSTDIDQEVQDDTGLDEVVTDTDNAKSLFEDLYEKVIARKNEVNERDPDLGDALDEGDGEAADIHDLWDVYDEEGIGSLDEVYDLDRFTWEEKLAILKTQAEELEKATGQTFMDIFQ